jgi:hypothetical protein
MSPLNTNGTVQFMDSAGTNSGGRFYRAVLPYPALPQPSGRGRGGSGRAASGLAGLSPASARAPADALGPGWRS